MQKLAIIGGGGHAAVILDLIQAINLIQPTYEVIGIFDDANNVGIQACPRLGTVGEIGKLDLNVQLVIAIGRNSIRQTIAQTYQDYTFASLVHPSAIIGSHVQINQGSVVMAGCIIQANARIGQHCIVNTGAILDHDSVVGDYSHIGQRATLTGGAKVGKTCYLGAGSTVAPWQVVADEIDLPVGSQIK
ncbi:MAG: acetyltransferase [Culicoidibacterales bacterium]